eukprot:TRINITY_DN8173_c0_g1_i1.p1 TRINITY_DN8173_c0_g1~~TRINITY_DN8173_c0_g1_i1.p1  ORF type:complete len:347 (-),score=75.89 TRINITY_DN8173_c0_g1_i1:8-1048(-)
MEEENPRRNVFGAPNAEEVKEYNEENQVLKVKAKKLADMIKSSKHFVVYTGAGVSTAAKIPDYRGPTGVWTLLAQGKKPEMKIQLDAAVPTFTHMAITELIKRDLCKFIVSTNLDGLHRRSGIKEDQIAELHGNVYKEVCNQCGAEYCRMFIVNKGNNVRRWTGRMCTKCNDGKLRDTIVNFGENLPENELEKATEQSRLADLTLVIGSSMRVTPACELPRESYSKGGVFNICNLQKTGYDSDVNGVRVFAKCDEFMREVMACLDIQVPVFTEDVKSLEQELDEIVDDPTWDKNDVMKKYNVYSMSDDGPPPKSILDQIVRGADLNRVPKHKTVEKHGDKLGKVLN